MNTREALAKLVALKDLKELTEAYDPAARYSVNEWQAMKLDYDRRKPLAWDAAREALAQPEPEPVAWVYWHPSDSTFDGQETKHKKAVSRFADDTRTAMQRVGWVFEPLYAAPPPPAPEQPARAALDELVKLDQELFPEQWKPEQDAAAGCPIERAVRGKP